MRCKNCGCENDDNLYICQNCGSPLYDEDETPDSEDSTRMFTPPAAGSNGPQKHDYDDYLDNFNNKTKADLPDYDSDDYRRRDRLDSRQGNNNRHKKDNGGNKKQIAIIVILIIVLIAIIAGIIAAASNGKKNRETTTVPLSSSTSESETQDETYERSSSRRRTTEESSKKETTTEKTTTSTTTTTTSSTTAKETQTYEVSVGTNDFGWADGGGTYKKGEKATVTCGADDSSVFVGWYKNGTKVSESKTYTFTVDSNAYVEARFKVKETQAPQPKADSTSAKANSDSND